MTQKARLAHVTAVLPRWYRKHQRDLPWRRSRDPYAIWVSEIMLQQTRVDQASPFFERFMRRFPNTRALARAPMEKVLKAWEGMGYYSRARNIHRAAQMILAEHDGEVPGDRSALLKLPGIGPYTAGAIASIAFGLDEPVLDGNVTRVLCRVFAIGEDPKASETQTKLWSLASRLIPPGSAGLFNQALMELGAMVCTPRGPACTACPIREACLAMARGRQEDYPARSRRKALPHETIVAGVIRKRSRILIDRRRPEGLLGGLWEFPGGKAEKGESLEQALLREIREEVGIRVRVDHPLAVVDHAYSHFRITLHAFACTHVSGQASPLHSMAVKWVWPGALGRYAFPAASLKVISALRRDASQNEGRCPN
jgi:A/G-specific adenine glycosylase